MDEFKITLDVVAIGIILSSIFGAAGFVLTVIKQVDSRSGS